jgi:drug/metabolite transporter (DMT)-like permease
MKNAKLQGETQAFTGAMLLMVATCAVIWSLNDFIAPLMSSEGHNMESVMSAVAEQAHAFSDWRVGAAVLWTGVVTTAITSFGENMAMKKLSASESTIIYSTEPLWGTAFAALALHEQIGANTIVGAVLILSACLWSSIGVASLIPALASAQIALSEVIEEVGENVSINFNSLFEKITETPGDI